MFCITIKDGKYVYYFAGWEGSDTTPRAGEMTYWRPKLNDPETYEYDDHKEASIELDLINDSDYEVNSIGIPDDFDYNSAFVELLKVRQDHD